MARLRIDIRIGQVTRCKPKSKRLGHPIQRWIDRVYKELAMLGILSDKGLATNRQMEESGDCIEKDTTTLY